MFDVPLRSLKERLVEPLARRMPDLSPTLVTIAAFVLGLLSALLASRSFYVFGLVFWILSRGLDGLDGTLARVHGKDYDYGGYLDILLDNIVYAALPIGIVMAVPSAPRYLALVLMLATFYINTVSWMYLAAILEKRAARAPQTLTTITMPGGLVGGVETFTAYCIFLVFPTQAVLLFSIFSAMVWITILQRIFWAKGVLTSPNL